MLNGNDRRFRAVALVMMLMLSLAGCARDTAPDTTTIPETTTPSRPTEPSATPSTGPTAPETPTEPGPNDPQVQIDALRASLTAVSNSAMTFYVGEDFVHVETTDHSCYTTDTMTLRAMAMHKYHLDNTITDMDTFARAYIELLGPEGTAQRTTHLGRELIVYSTDTATTVTGLYMLEDTLGIIEITADPAQALKTVMDYAVLGQLTHALKPPEQVGVEHTLAGLALMLDATFLPGYQGEIHANYYNEDISVTMSLEAPGSGDTAADMAASFAQTQAPYWSKIDRKTRNGVPYVICTDADHKQCLMVGFYAAGDTAWTITAESFQPDGSSSQMSKIVTGGQIQIPEIDLSAPGEQTVTCDGLALDISNIFTVEVSDFGVTCFHDGTTITITSSTPETAGMTFTTSADMAAYQVSRYQDQWERIETRERSGITYVLFQDHDGYSKLTACYVSEGKSWNVSAYGYWDESGLDAMIQTVTRGILP